MSHSAMLKNLSFGLMAFFVAFGISSSCGGGGDQCVSRNVRCDAPLKCDPADGICKCGGRGGYVCPEGFGCDGDSNTCLPLRCKTVDCSQQPGTSCDVLDGLCKCGGTGGDVCAAEEICNPNAKSCLPRLNCNEVACPKNQTCDTVTGKCRCGAVECAFGQFCSLDTQGARTCITDLCNGVACAGANQCDANDGYCKCNGAVCQSGESCACPDGGACVGTERTCKPGSACLGVTCGGGTTCDPTDGQCKCGGPGGPTCASNQICSLGPPPQCQGGQQCQNPDGGAKSCTGGTSCDPEDGRCKCGGRGGKVCTAPSGTDPGEVCVSNPVQQACRRPCDVRASDCPTGTYCYFDTSAATPAAYCSAPTDSRVEDNACTTATSCFATSPSRSLHCNGLTLGQAGICRPYCDVAAGSSGCIQVPRAQTCVQIQGAPAGYGYCQPQ